MTSFFKVKTPEEVFSLLRTFATVGEETVPLDEALDRILCRDIGAPEDLPGFFRSAMDGYAVQAGDTYGASESLPGLFQVVGDVPMGQAPTMAVRKGEAVRIATGGMLPEGADGVVMVEYCHLMDETTLEVNRAISPLENVIQPTDDFERGATVLSRGHRLRPQDLGVLAGLGVGDIPVYRRPRVAILSTGDEVIPMHERPKPGQVRDINRYTLGAFCRRLGADPLEFGICRDLFDGLKARIQDALEQADTVWISGGSSVGVRDLSLEVLETLPRFELLVHGISISPGKPTIIGRVGPKPLIGLPGHVASALVVAEVFLTRLIRRISGGREESDATPTEVEAELSRNVESAGGREDYIRVRLKKRGASFIADPIFGKSALISTLVEADGLLRVDMHTEGLYQGQKVKVLLFNRK
jgi:molybdopterin molybdotransferase